MNRLGSGQSQIESVTMITKHGPVDEVLGVLDEHLLDHLGTRRPDRGVRTPLKCKVIDAIEDPNPVSIRIWYKFLDPDTKPFYIV